MKESKLNNVKEWIENKNEEKLREEVANDDEDQKAIYKFFNHWNKNGNPVESSYGVVYSSPFYLLVRSQFYSDKKARKDQDNIGTFHGIWVIGIDKTQDSGFFIHRMQHDSSDRGAPFNRFEDNSYEWTKDDIKQKMGFDEHYTGQDIETEVKYRIQGDITIQRLEDEISNSSDDISQHNITLGNHLLMIENVDKRTAGASFNGVRNWFNIPDSGTLFVIHDEHNNQKVRLPEGRYQVNAMDRHEFD